jgi:hypothetical protein
MRNLKKKDTAIKHPAENNGEGERRKKGRLKY